MQKITIKTDYITLGQFLKFTSIITNGGEAKFYLSTHEIVVNSEIESRRGRKLFPGDRIVANNKEFIIEAQQ